jgi:hypothetical protein
MLGRMPSSIPASRYSGSKPSMQITTVGRWGKLYVRPWRWTDGIWGEGSDILDCSEGCSVVEYLKMFKEI